MRAVTGVRTFGLTMTPRIDLLKLTKTYLRKLVADCGRPPLRGGGSELRDTTASVLRPVPTPRAPGGRGTVLLSRSVRCRVISTPA